MYIPFLMHKISITSLVGLLILTMSSASFAQRSVEAIKADILDTAQKYAGQGDPDFNIQNELQPLVDELLEASPQPPVRERLHLLAAPWKQVWGPYDYDFDERGVDPELDLDEIYQVVSKDGYYWNIAPTYQDGDRSNVRISTLRGEYKLLDDRPDMIKIRFTRFPGVKGRPENLQLWKLAELAEKRQLPNKTTIVPTWIVRLFFGGGGLREVYTDENLRITYGDDSISDRSQEYLYIMVRADKATE